MMDYEELIKRLETFDKAELIDLISRVYEKQDERVNEYINNRLQQESPGELVGSFRDRINGWLDSRSFVSYGESFQFACEIQDAREEIEEMLLPADPEAAWKLADKVVRGDGKIIESVDDSGGAVGTELNEFCLLWLKAAKALNLGDDYWAPIVMEITEGNEYGCRELFLQSADILLERETLQNIYNTYKERLLNHDGPNERAFDFTRTRLVVRMQKTALAMQDPKAYEAALLLLSPSPNNLQMKNIIQVYLQFGKFTKARALLEETEWEERFHSDRDGLYRELFEKTGDTEQLLLLKEKKWREDPCLFYLEKYLAAAGPAKEKQIRAEAQQRALSDSDPMRAVSVLIFLNKIEDAEQRLLEVGDDLEHVFYPDLLDMLEQLGPDRGLYGQVVLYRLLLNDILDRGYSKAYRHAANYYRALEELDSRIPNLPANLASHQKYMEKLKEKHGRKQSFWKRVE